MPDPFQIVEIPTGDAGQVNQLVSDAFGYRKPHQFFQDFPIWGSDRVRRFGIFKNTALISHVGMRTTQLGTASVGLVGAVATHALHRGQGLSSQLLAHVIAQAKQQKLDWLVLWGSEHEFYSKFGFELSGVQTRIGLGDFVQAHAPAPSPKIERGYIPEIFGHLLKAGTGQQVQLKPEDRAWFERHETVKWYWTAKPFAFAGFERGMDLPHLVHECGGDPRALAAIFEQILREDPSAELLTHPRLLPLLGLPATVAQTQEQLCLSKPVGEPGPWPEPFWISGLNAC